MTNVFVKNYISILDDFKEDINYVKYFNFVITDTHKVLMLLLHFQLDLYFESFTNNSKRYS